MIKRDRYLQRLIANRANGFPKIVTGIRRCGKSYLIKEIYRRYLIDQGMSEDDILIIELDDDRNARLRDPLYLGEHVREYCKGRGDCVVFLDVIQSVYTIVNHNLTEGKHVLAKKDDTQTISFVDTILGLSRESNIDLYVSGSNSRMLSSDIVTEFRDKAVEIRLSPLSFDEYHAHKGGSPSDDLYEYMQFGGMPLAVLKDEDERRGYLKGLFETTYFRDIIERNALRKSSSMDELCNILSASTGQLLNAEKISNTYRSVRHTNIDKQTVERYIGYFVDAFLLQEARRYDLKGRAEIGALRKYYFVDTGLRNARLNFAFPDEGQMLENVIYNELTYQGYSVNVGTFDSIEKNSEGRSVRKTNEVDFYARKGIDRYYIQVASDISDAETRARELRPYLMLNDEVKKIVVVNRPINECLDENGFTVIGATDFLLRFIKK